MSRIILISAGVLIFIFFATSPCLYAEKIYLKNGNVVNEEISRRQKGTIWIKQQGGAIGFDLQNIERIENDDGSISKYDYPSLLKTIQEDIIQKKYDSAIRLCGVLLESFPDNTQIHYLRGILSQERGDFSTAAEDYNFLVEHKSADARIFNNLGTIIANNKNYNEAMSLFIKALEENPAMIEARENLGQLLIQTKEYGRAVDEYKKVVDLQPDNIEALYNLGLAYLNSGNLQEAKAQYQRVLSIKPEDDDVNKILKYIEQKSTVVQ